MSGQELEIREAELQEIPGLIFLGPRPYMPGHQALFRFENGYGASVIYGAGSYGVELATLVFPEGASNEDYVLTALPIDLDDSNPSGPSDGIYGWLNKQDLLELLERIRRLAPAITLVKVSEELETERLEDVDH